MNILVLNPGSSSLKFSLFQPTAGSSAPGEELLAVGSVDRIGTDQATLRFRSGNEPETTQPIPAESPARAAEQVVARCLPLGVDATAYRVVHGGAIFAGPALITPQVLGQIASLNELAPLHNPVALATIEAAMRQAPGRPAVAVFDTSFHRTLPEVAFRYALPPEFADPLGVRRYGFHGISHGYVSRQMLLQRTQDGKAPDGDTRIITCHLGNGASVCAVRNGRSIDTSMGFTPLEGLVMGTRSGDLDPGLVLYLMDQKGMAAAQLDDLLNRRSGLRGLSGTSSDVRDLEQSARNGDARAELALDMFAYRVKKYIGAYIAALGGLDALVFTGGIGEHSADQRHRICQGLDCLGLRLDQERNRTGLADGSHLSRIDSQQGLAEIWIIRTDEERQIVREAYALLHAER